MGARRRRAQTSAYQWRKRAEVAWRDLAEIDSLPVAEAAQLVRAQQEQAQHEVAERASRQSPAAQIHDHGPAAADHGMGL